MNIEQLAIKNLEAQIDLHAQISSARGSILGGVGFNANQTKAAISRMAKRDEESIIIPIKEYSDLMVFLNILCSHDWASLGISQADAVKEIEQAQRTLRTLTP